MTFKDDVGMPEWELVNITSKNSTRPSFGILAAGLIADRITIISKYPENEQCAWTHAIINNYFTIRPDTSESLVSGTKVILDIREEFVPEYLTKSRLNAQ